MKKCLSAAALSIVVLGPGSLLGAVPDITTQPSSQTNYSGATVQFVVSANGTAPLAYQWRKNGSPLTDQGNISGTGSDTLVLSNVTPADMGNYSVAVSNADGATNSADAALTVYTLLVQNGGFETSQFTGWTQSGNVGGTSIPALNSLYVHSGSYGVRVGPSGQLGYLSQTVPTVAGQPYLLSLWLNPQGIGPSEFTVAWSGQTLLDYVNMPANGWTNLHLVLAGTGTNTLLQFGFRNDPSYFGFDDVSLEPVPGRMTVTRKGANPGLTWNALAGFKYQVQYKDSPAQTTWTDLGTPQLVPTNSTVTQIDNTAPVPRQRFYRLGVLP